MTKKTTPTKTTKAATTPAKPTAVKTPVTKTAAPVADVVVAASPAAAVAAPLRAIDRAEFEAIVRTEAHGLALARGYRNGSPFADWVSAEAAVLARLVAEGRSVAPATNDTTRA